MSKKIGIVITTIQTPTPCVLQWIEHSKRNHAPMYIIGDSVGPETYHPHCDFFPISRQKEMPYRLAESLPFRHYSRKNLGYLEAARQGVDIIYETDDDNHPLPHWTPRLNSNVDCSVVNTPGWVNSFLYFTKEKIWPRGLPLDEILKPIPEAISGQKRYSPVQQGLANGEPDVDAIWRFVFEERIDLRSGNTLFLDAGCWSPFNSQSTWWHSEVFPLMYLPTFCSFRMTDIWRSFVTQRCLWEMNTGVTIHPAEVEQLRNPHVIFSDFKKEIDGYLKNKEMCAMLSDLNLKGKDCGANLIQCYESLIAKGYFPSEELPLVTAWVEDIYSLQSRCA